MASPRLIGVFVLLAVAAHVAAQSPPELPALKPGDVADALLVGKIPAPGEKDESGKPALPSFEPVAFFVAGQLRGCYLNHPSATDDPIPKPTIDTLNRIYASGRRYPLWFAGASWGEAIAVKSCMDEDMDLDGCFRVQRSAPHPLPAGGFNATIWTGQPTAPSHFALRRPASSQERSTFLAAASSVYGAHHVRVAPTSIHTSAVIFTQLQSNHGALIASTIVQLPSTVSKTWYSYRLFLVLEQDSGEYKPVLERFHRTTIPLDEDMTPPAPGRLLDEEGDTDREEFMDSFPLFPGEPDAIITRHNYYEDWAFSLYRLVGPHYELISTACGGGV